MCPVADDPRGIVAGVQLRRKLRRRLHNAAARCPGGCWCHRRRAARCCIPGLSCQLPLLLLLHRPPLQRFRLRWPKAQQTQSLLLSSCHVGEGGMQELQDIAPQHASKDAHLLATSRGHLQRTAWWQRSEVPRNSRACAHHMGQVDADGRICHHCRRSALQLHCASLRAQQRGIFSTLACTGLQMTQQKSRSPGHGDVPDTRQHGTCSEVRAAVSSCGREGACCTMVRMSSCARCRSAHPFWSRSSRRISLSIFTSVTRRGQAGGVSTSLDGACMQTGCTMRLPGTRAHLKGHPGQSWCLCEGWTHFGPSRRPASVSARHCWR